MDLNNMISKKFSKMPTFTMIGNFCEVHNGEELVKFENETEEFCVKCEQEKRDTEFTKKTNEEYSEYLKLKKYNTLREKSILTDKKLLNCTFTNFLSKNTVQQKNKSDASKIVQKYLDGDFFNCLFSGNAGAGKSHTAMSILKAVNEGCDKKYTSLFVSVDEMFRLLRNSFGNSESKYTELYFTELLGEVDFLVLDDLGAEIGSLDSHQKSKDYMTQLLYAITNKRQDKATIITTNLNKSLLEDKYDVKLVSRFLGKHCVLKFTSEDQRAKKIEI